MSFEVPGAGNPPTADARCDSLTDCTCADGPIPYLTIAATRRAGAGSKDP